MPSVIESRIVSMVFDNKQFEKNVATSQKTLENLNNTLEFKDAKKNLRGLEDASKMVTFSEMRTSIGDIATKMKASTVIGIELLKNLTNSAINFAKTWANKVIAPITSGGWNRATAIDQAEFKLKGLGIAWSEIEDDINYGVRDTAYGLGSAASAAAQFAASGVQLGDDMKTALRGISGVAAMTSSTYDDIAHIFTGIAGIDRVFADDLNSLASRGLNAKKVLADYLHTTEANISDMVSKGKIDFATFSKAMDDAFGEHAKKGNETFEGSLDNMKSALGRIGAEFAGSFRDNMIPVWNALRVAFNNVKAAMGPVFEIADAVMTDMSDRFVNVMDKWDAYVVKSGALKSIFAGAADYMEGAYKLAITVFETIHKAIAIVTPAVNTYMVMSNGILAKTNRIAEEYRKNFFAGPAKSFAEMAKSFNELTSSRKFRDNIIKGVLTVADTVKMLFSLVIDIKNTAVNAVRTVINGFRVGFTGVDKPVFNILKALDTVKRIVAKIVDIFKSQGVNDLLNRVLIVLNHIGFAIGVLFGNIKQIASKAVSAWEKVFPIRTWEKYNLGKFFESITSRISHFIQTLKLSGDQTEAIGKHFTSLFVVLKVGKQIFNTIASVIGTLIANILGLWRAAKDAFFEIFDGSAASGFAFTLNRLIDTVQKFIAKLMFSDTAIENFKRAFAGIFAVVSIVKDIFVAAFGVVQRVFTNIMGDVTRNTEGAVNGITGIIGRIGDFLVRIREWLTETGAIEKASNIIYHVIASIINFIRKIPDAVIKAKEAFDAFVTNVTGSSLSDHFDKIKERVQNAWETIKSVFSRLASSNEIDNAEKKVSPLASLFDFLKTSIGSFSGFLQKAWPVLNRIITGITGIISNLFKNVSGLFSSIGSNFEGGGLSSMLLGIGATATGISSGLSILDGLSEKITGPINALKEAFSSFQESLDSGKLKKIAISIALIAASVIAFALVNPAQLAGAMIAMKKMMEMLHDFMIRFYALADKMGKSGIKEFRKLASALLILAPAIYVIAGAVKKLGGMDLLDLAKGMLALDIMLKELAGFAEKLSKLQKNIVSASAALILIAVALAIMVIPMKAFGKMEWEQIVKGLAAVGGLLLEFVIITKLLQGGSALSAAATVIILSTALVMLTIPMKVFSKMKWEQIAKGLAAVGGLLLEFVLVTHLMKGGQALAAAATVSILAVALLLMIAPMEAFAHMEWEQIAKGLAAVGGLLLEFVLVTKLLKGSSAMFAAATVIALAIAMNLLIIPMEAFGRLEWSQIGKGLLVMAGALAILVIAGYAAAPVVGVIVALSVAVALLGAATLMIGAGIMLMATGLTLMAGIGPEIGDTIKAVLAAVLSLIPLFVENVMLGLNALLAGIFGLIETLIVGIFTMFPTIISGILGLLGNILNAIVGFLPTLLSVAPQLFGGIFQLIRMFLEAFAEEAPAIFEALGEILSEFLLMLAGIMPELFALVGQILLGIINVIRETAPALIETVFEIILKLLEELAKNAADITELVLDTLLSVIEMLTLKLPDITLKVVEFIIALINSIADTLWDKGPEIRDAIAKLIGSIIKMVLELFGIDTSNMDQNMFTDIGKNLLGGFIGGFFKKLPEWWQKIKDWFKSIGEWFKQKFEDFKNFGKRIVEGLRDGIHDKIEEVKEKITGFFGKIGDGVKNFFGIHSPSRFFADIGKYIMEGFQQGAEDEHKTVGEKVAGFFGKIGDGVKTLFGIDKEDGMFAGFGKKIMGAFQKAVGKNSDEAEKEVTGVFDSVTKSAASSEEAFVDIGKKLMSGLVLGMQTASKLVFDCITKVVEETIRIAGNLVPKFTEIGQNAMAGLIVGMTASSPAVQQAASKVAHDAEKAARLALKVESPSKVFAEIGMNVDRGLANGMNHYSNLISDAGEDIGTTAIDSVSQAIALVGSMVEDMGGDPVIRPVLDLTEIENGTSRIANMFGDPTIGANSLFGGVYADETVSKIKMNGNPAVSTTTNTTNNKASINISVNAAPGQNAEEIADAVQRRLTQSLNQRGYAFR